jgi:hypothetical protein
VRTLFVLALMTVSTPNGDLDAVSASVALMALRAGHQDRDSARAAYYVIEPDTDALGRKEAARALAAMPKPVDCERAVSNGLLHIRCSTIVRTDLARSHFVEASEIITDFEQAITGWGQSMKEDPKLHVRGTQEALIVRFSAIKAFLRDYSLSSFGARLDPPDETARGLGAAAILVLGRGEFRLVDDSQTPP